MRLFPFLTLLLFVAVAGRDVVAADTCGLNCITLRNRSGTAITAVAVVGSIEGSKPVQWVEKDLRPGETRCVKVPSPAPAINDVLVLACLPKGSEYALRAFSSPFDAPPPGRRIRSVFLDLVTTASRNALTGAREFGVGGTFHVYLGGRASSLALPLEVGAAGTCDAAAAANWSPFRQLDGSAGSGRIPKPFHHISIKNLSSKPVVMARGRNNAVPTIVHRVGPVAPGTGTETWSDCTCPPVSSPKLYDSVNSTRDSDLCVLVTLPAGDQWYAYTADAGVGFEIKVVDITVSNNGAGVTVAGKVKLNNPTNSTTLTDLDITLAPVVACGFN